MTTDLDIDSEFAALKTRKAKLIRLQKIRREVGELELAALTESNNPHDAVGVMKVVCEEVCHAFNLDMERLSRKSREDHIATPRQVVWYLGRELSGMTLHGIGRIFHKNHGTVLHGCKKIRDRIATEPKFAAAITRISDACTTRLAQATMPDND